MNFEIMDAHKEKIITILKFSGIYEFVKNSPHIYIGGSLPALCLSIKETDYINKTINDIDIYTKNITMCLRDINKYLKPKNILKSGVNITFNLNKKSIQIISSYFEDFEIEVLDTYDCDICAVGYHPHTNEFIIRERFIKAFEEKNFIVKLEKTNESRIQKLFDRAEKFFSSSLTIENETNEGDFSSYYKKKLQISNVSKLDISPPYIQMYLTKYKCCLCDKINEYLVCSKCTEKINLSNSNTIINHQIKKLTVFGGVNGFGKIIGNQAEAQGIQVIRTSRNPTEKFHYSFDLSDGKISDDLMTQIMTSDCVIFNAYQTLESDHKIWTTKIDNFDEELALQRFTINCFGYVKIINQIIQARIKLINSTHSSKKSNNVSDIVFVFMDANESKYEGKLSDGKHLELNMAKSACKQIFYTNAQSLSSLGIITVAWDPCWMSYHGISMEKIESKSKFLIPPSLGADILLSYIKSLDLEKLYSEKIFIHDKTFYSCVKKYK